MKHMKKLLSVLLAALLLMTTVSVIAFAEDNSGYTQVYTVRVQEKYQKMIALEPADGDENTVAKGGDFRFGVKYLGNYRPDSSTVIKAYPASFPYDLYYQDNDTTDIVTLTPDEYGIYTIPDVQEDWYVVVFSLQEGQISSLKDMLFKFLQTFLNFFKKLFNLG